MATYRLASGDPGGAGAFVARLETLTLVEMVSYIQSVLLQSTLTATLTP